MASIRFGTDGWRGIIAEDFTFANARIVAHAIARYVVRGEDARKGVLIGYDHRFASDRFASAVAEAISAKIESELEKVQREGVPPLPIRKDLIQPLEPRAPYLDTIEKLVDWQRLRDAKFRFLCDPMHGSAAVCFAISSREMASLAMKFAGVEIRASPEFILSRSSRTSKPPARRCAPENTMPRSAPMAMATASAPSTAMVRLSPRTKSSRCSSGTWPEQEKFRAT